MQTPKAKPLKVEPATGLLTGVRQVLSPHFDARPSGCVPEHVVVHGISLPPDEHPYFRTISGARVSAHALIRRDGQIVQYVPFGERAWHAGISEYRGRSACNDFSIGIELEGTDTVPYADSQYEQLAVVIGALLATYSTLSREHIVGHSDVAPGRKTDPGPVFDWDRLRGLLR